MEKSRIVLLFGMVCAILIAGWGYVPAHAVGSYGWSPDDKVPGYLDDTYTPLLLADRNRTVHAFASQWVENQGRRLAIVYRQWTLIGGWTRPVDIILSPLGGNANLVGAFLDSSDTIHIVFLATEALTRRSSIYYTSASAANADLAPAWSIPVLIGNDSKELNTASIIGDDQGNLVVIYSGIRDGSGLYYVYSKDFGRNWSKSLPLFLTFDNELSTYSLRLTIGPDQKISAVWNVVTNLGRDEALYFANFDSVNYDWDIPVELDRRIDLQDYFGPSFPVMVDNGREIVVMYNGGNPFTGRPVGAGRPIQRTRISGDRGLTWSEPLDPFPFHLGRSGEHAMTLDGDGNSHALFTQRIEPPDEDGNYTVIGGIWHSIFQNGIWSKPDRIVLTVPAHDVHAVVSQGNVLLVVWRQDPGTGQSGIWYSYNILDIPELPVIPLATASVNLSGRITPTAAINPSTIEPSPQPALLEDAPPSNLGNNPALPIIIGTVPVILLLIGIVLGYHFLNRRRN